MSVWPLAVLANLQFLSSLLWNGGSIWSKVARKQDLNAAQKLGRACYVVPRREGCAQNARMVGGGRGAELRMFATRGAAGPGAGGGAAVKGSGGGQRAAGSTRGFVDCMLH